LKKKKKNGTIPTSPFETFAVSKVESPQLADRILANAERFYGKTGHLFILPLHARLRAEGKCSWFIQFKNFCAVAPKACLEQWAVGLFSEAARIRFLSERHNAHSHRHWLPMLGRSLTPTPVILKGGKTGFENRKSQVGSSVRSFTLRLLQ